ncbi:hypothetical protein GH733_001296, partial [Mirounga leonina]
MQSADLGPTLLTSPGQPTLTRVPPPILPRPSQQTGSSNVSTFRPAYSSFSSGYGTYGHSFSGSYSPYSYGYNGLGYNRPCVDDLPPSRFVQQAEENSRGIFRDSAVDDSLRGSENEDLWAESEKLQHKLGKCEDDHIADFAAVSEEEISFHAGDMLNLALKEQQPKVGGKAVESSKISKQQQSFTNTTLIKEATPTDSLDEQEAAFDSIFVETI